MKKYICDVCSYVYDPEVGDPDNGIKPGTRILAGSVKISFTPQIFSFLYLP